MFMLRRIPPALIATALLLTAIGYGLYHAEHGAYGRRASVDVSRDVITLQTELAGLTKERERLEHIVSLLRPESLDPDMLDEKARLNLGYARDDELIIFHDR